MKAALALALNYALFPLTAHAASIKLPLPKSAYPARTTEIKAKTISGDQYDCSWSVSCDAGVFLLHSYASTCTEGDVTFSQATPDNPTTCLGRVSGWGEAAVTDVQTPKEITYAVFGSTYDSSIDASGSAQDFVDTSSASAGFKLAKQQPNMLPASDLGGSAVLVFKSGIPSGVNAYLTVCFEGTAEVEATATWLSGSHTQAKALKWLIELTQKALVYQLANP